MSAANRAMPTHSPLFSASDMASSTLRVLAAMIASHEALVYARASGILGGLVLSFVITLTYLFNGHSLSNTDSHGFYGSTRGNPAATKPSGCATQRRLKPVLQTSIS